MSNVNRLAKQVEKWYDAHLWFRTIFLAMILWIAWVFYVPSGQEALLDIEHTVSRNAVYEEIQILRTTRTGRRRNTREEVYISFEDGTQVQVQVNTSPLKRGLQGIEAGEELYITLDESEQYLLGVEYQGEVLIDAQDSIKRMNISAWGFMILGAGMGVSAFIMVIRDVIRGVRKRNRRRRR